MKKRQELRAQNRQKANRNRIIVVGVIVVVVAFIVFLLTQLGQKAADISNLVQITPVAYTSPVNKTSIGNPSAAIKLDVWEDFQCSGCLAYTKNLEAQVIQTFVETGQVYYTFHYFPFIDGGQGESHQAANAAACAAAQGRFRDYHDILFANWIGENAGSYTNPKLIAFAKSIGLDMTAFNQCFQADTYAADIQKDYDAGASLGVPPTPGIFVNGKAVLSSAGGNYLPTFDDISNAIKAAKP